jgi:hypothetical protein
MAGILPLIWGRGEAVYFCKRGWTGQISLKLLRKIAQARTAILAEAMSIQQLVTRLRRQSKTGLPPQVRHHDNLRDGVGWHVVSRLALGLTRQSRRSK